jgi:hypothetical protein
MTSRITARDVADHLATTGHTDSTRGPNWTPGHRTQQASPRTIRIWHDGPDEQHHLDQYTPVLQAAGYTVTVERPRGRRPALRVTRP